MLYAYALLLVCVGRAGLISRRWLISPNGRGSATGYIPRVVGTKEGGGEVVISEEVGSNHPAAL